MNKPSHTIITTIFLISLWIFIKLILGKDYFIWVFILPLIVIGSGPDFDHAWKFAGHRNWAFHSVIPEVILLIFILPYNIDFLSFFFLLMIPVVGLHCFCDVRWVARKRVGFYTIKVWMRPSLSILDKENKQNIIVWKTLWGLNGGVSTIWLAGNFLCSIVY